jgi:tetratricopeptide (TPR) repeat protein
MNHALKRRSHAKRVPWKRQLLALAAGTILAWPIPWAKGESPASKVDSPSSLSAAAGELRAAKLMALNLAARNADTEAWSKLDKIYFDLDIKYSSDIAVKVDCAQYFWDRGEKRRAMERWESAAKMDPKNGPALSSLGNGYLELGDVKRAAAYFTRASESVPSNASYHFELANVDFLFRHDLQDAAAPDDAGMIQRALSHFGEAARLEPLSVEYAKAYADTFYYVQPPDWAAALTAWKRYLEITPYKDFAYLNLARVQMKLGRKEEARASLAEIHDAGFDQLKTRLNQKMDAE